MQFTLSTIFLIFFNVAASLALCGPFGSWVSASMLLAALALNKSSPWWNAIAPVMFIIFIGVICPGAIWSRIYNKDDMMRHSACMSNLKLCGSALHDYYGANKHFPPVYTRDDNGKPLFSWRVEILQMPKYEPLDNSLKKDEPWNSPNNIKALDQIKFVRYKCPSAAPNEKDYSTNYMAVIGPGTAWREDGTVKLVDLPDGGSHTVMLVEVVNSGVHWAEPRDLTVDEALEGLKTGKGVRISTAHSQFISVLFADGEVRALPSKMPISLWKKILAGEVTDLDNIESKIDTFAADMVDVSINPEPSKWPIILGVIVWLFSVVLLFRRAIKSRVKSGVVESSQEQLAEGDGN
jgi:hypothetical protein